jgi:hypothetical protein
MSSKDHPKMIIFYSWQSYERRTNFNFIEESIDRAIKLLKRDDSVLIEPVMDRDTAGIPGSPTIDQAIFDKIAQADIFICDVSFINPRSTERLIPNPNVMLELGYAIAHLGWNKIIMVLNTAFGQISEAPFDIRNKRIINYHLDPQALSEKSSQRQLLVQKLEVAIRGIITSIEPKIESPFIPSFPTLFMQNVGVDPSKDSSFGKNTWSNNLGERFVDIIERIPYAKTVPAKSWITVTVEPLSPLELDIREIARKYQPAHPIADPKAHARFIMPERFGTEIDSIIYYDEEHEFNKKGLAKTWTIRYLRIFEHGGIDFSDSTAGIFHHFRNPSLEQRVFGFVPIIGVFWRILSLARRIYQDIGYSGGLAISLNLIGTENTRLGYFSEEVGSLGKKWPKAFSDDEAISYIIGEVNGQPICRKPFLQLTRIFDGSENNDETIIYDLAQRLGDAYNHQSEPRCFNRDTRVFPWHSFEDLMSRI